MTKLKYCYIQGKVRFPTYWAAERVHQSLNRKRHHIGGCVYRCTACHDYHLTHYDEAVNPDDLIFTFRKRSKKELRSRRNRKKQESRPFKGEQLHEIFNTMRIKPIVPSTPHQVLALKLSQSFGELKMFVGGTTYCALTQMHEALVALEHCPTYRHEAKKQLKQAREEWDRYERGLKQPSPLGLRFFCVADIDEPYRKRYGDITDAEYFEFWTGMGGNMYAKCKNHIDALTYKFERYLLGHNVREAKAYAVAMTADALLQLACIVYDLMSVDIQKSTPPTIPSFVQMSEPLNPTRIKVSFRRAIETMFLCKLPCLTEEETKNIKLTTDDISHVWSDPLVYIDIQHDTIEDYADDVFRTKGEAKKVLRLNAERRAEVEEEMFAKKVDEFKNDKTKTNATEIQQKEMH